MSQDARPIIIKKKKGGGHGGHHGGAWKVAYADFVTAMMAFFLVMWIMGLSEDTKRAIAGYFREPGVFSFTTGKALPVNVEVTQTSHRGDGSGATGSEKKSDLIEISTSRKCLAALGEGETERIAALEQAVKERLEELASSRPDLKQILESITVEITDEGLRIELAESHSLAFFDVGTARPNRICIDVLTALAPKLAQIGNPVVIEGHTDARTFPRGATYTNWELSADRANAARKILLERGVTPSQLASVTGYAETRLRKPAAPHDLANRRVSVVVKYRESDAATPPAPASPGPPRP